MKVSERLREMPPGVSEVFVREDINLMVEVYHDPVGFGVSEIVMHITDGDSNVQKTVVMERDDAARLGRVIRAMVGE